MAENTRKSEQTILNEKFQNGNISFETFVKRTRKLGREALNMEVSSMQNVESLKSVIEALKLENVKLQTEVDEVNSKYVKLQNQFDDEIQRLTAIIDEKDRLLAETDSCCCDECCENCCCECECDYDDAFEDAFEDDFEEDDFDSDYDFLDEYFDKYLSIVVVEREKYKPLALVYVKSEFNTAEPKLPFEAMANMAYGPQIVIDKNGTVCTNYTFRSVTTEEFDAIKIQLILDILYGNINATHFGPCDEDIELGGFTSSLFCAESFYDTLDSVDVYDEEIDDTDEEDEDSIYISEADVQLLFDLIKHNPNIKALLNTIKNTNR